MASSVGLLVLLACFFSLSVSYSTSGNKFLDASGKQIVFRGFARPSLEWNAAGENLGLSDYQLMKNWGANVVRLSLNQCYYLSGNSGYTSSYAGTIDQQVTWIKSLGLGVILDLHWSNQGKTGVACGQQTMPDSVSTTFWNAIATKYKNDPSVIFELYNEPHDVSWTVWRNGGDAGGWNTPGFQSLYNTVRATGANNVVLIGGLNYAYDLSGVAANPITGTNIGYVTHPYNYAGKQPSDWDVGFGNLAANYPVFATEFGVYDCSTSYINSFIQYANSKCISWTAWAWYVNGCSFPSVISDWSGTATPGSGAAIKAALATPFTCGSSSATTASATTSTTKSSTTTTTTTTTTGSSTANTISVYKDTAVLSPFQDWSWAATKNAADTSTKQAGTTSYSFTLQNYDAIYFFYQGGIQKSIHKSIEFYVNIGSTGNTNWNFNMITYSGSSSNVILPDNSVANYCGTLSANTWVKCTATLSTFTSVSTFDGFWFQDKNGASKGTVYVDSITVIGL